MILQLFEIISVISAGIAAILYILKIIGVPLKWLGKKAEAKRKEEINNLLIAQKDEFTKMLQDFNDSINNKFIACERTDEMLITATRDVLRRQITSIYYRYKTDKKIPYYEKQLVEILYKDYKAEGGNSFVDLLYSRINEWEVIPDEY